MTTLETKPANATLWSTRSLAAQTGMTQSVVSRIWRAFGLKAHRVDTFKISKDPLFVDKVRDVVGLYLDPPAAAVVLLRRGVHRSVAALEHDIRGWIQRWNTDPKPYVRTRTADQILESLATYCQRINDSEP